MPELGRKILRPYIWGWGLIRFVNHDNSMDMVGHHHKCIQFYKWKMFRDFMAKSYFDVLMNLFIKTGITIHQKQPFDGG